VTVRSSVVPRSADWILLPVILGTRRVISTSHSLREWTCRSFRAQVNLYYIDRATCETKLHFTGRARRCGALLGSHGRDSLQGRPPNGEDVTDDERRTGCETRRVSSTKQGRKNAEITFEAKLDGLTTRNTTGSERDI